MEPRAASRFVLAAALVAAGCVPRPAGVAEGDAWPAPRIEALGGAAAPAGIGAGQPVVVTFWATWCEPCRREMPSLEALHRAGTAGVRVVGVSVDEDRLLAQEFARRLGVTFPNGRADAATLAREPLGLRGFPTTFVVDAAGVVRWRAEGARDWASGDTARRLAAVLGRAP